MSATVPAQTATLTAVSTSTTVATLAAASGNRQMVTIYNDAAAILYVKFGATASSTDFTVALAASTGYYEIPQPRYGGIITGTLASGTGTARVTAY